MFPPISIPGYAYEEDKKIKYFVLIFHTYSVVTEHSSLTSCADREIVGRLGLA